MEAKQFEDMRGRFERVPFVNKAGREIEGQSTLFFVPENGERIFLRTWSGSVPREAIESVVGQTVLISGRTATGLWDTDDPNVQSRVGDYIELDRLTMVKDS